MAVRVTQAFMDSLRDLPFDRRELEPESMEETAEDYAGMDFTESNGAFVEDMSPMIPRGSSVVDYGCGPGDIVIMLARLRPDLRITGVDLSPSMLKIAGRKAERAGVGDRLSWKVGDITRPVQEIKGVDFAYSHTTLHHLREVHPFFVQMAEALRPRGGYYIRDLRRPATAREAMDWIREATAGGLTQRQYELFFYSLRAALTPGEVEAELEATGISGVVEVPRNPKRYWVLRCAPSEVAGEACAQR